MRQASALLGVVALSLAQLPLSSAAAAVEGYDALYIGQSAFLTLAPGVSGTFTVNFLNTGTTTWIKDTGTQVDLAACRADKVTCDAQDPTESPFDPGTWVSATRYATHAAPTVPPNSIASFSYSVKPPFGTVESIYRFNGDLVLASTGQRIHPEGSYQDVRVTAPTALIELTPETESDEVNITHTVTATYISATGVATANVPIDFFVVRDASPFGSTGACSRAFGALPSFSGAKPCEIDSADLVTGSTGKVQFSWSGSFEETHRVVAWTGSVGSVYESTDPLTQGSATMTWHARAAGIGISPDARTGRFASPVTLTAQVERDDGTALAVEGASVVWHHVRNGNDSGSSCNGGTTLEIKPTLTDATGGSSYTFAGPPDPSPALGSSSADCVFVFYDRNGSGLWDSSEPSDAVRVAFSDAASGSGPTVTLSPAAVGLDDGATHTVTASLRDVFGDPIVGTVTLQINRSRVTTGVKEAQGVVTTTTIGTNASGNATYTYAGPGYGATDTIDACADRNGDGDCIDAGDVLLGAVTDVVTHWTNEGTTSQTPYRGRVLLCDTAANVLHVYVQAGATTGNLRFSYATGGQMYLDQDAVIDEGIDGQVVTTATWESKCAVDDPVVIEYTVGGSSRFENEGKKP